MSAPNTIVDVVIPVFNGRDTICTSIASVLAQIPQVVRKIIVVDDGSTDGTAEVVWAMDCPQVELIRTENRGVAAARNLGIERTCANWVAFLDADDLWEPSKLAVQIQAADQYKVDFICSAVSTGEVRQSGIISVVSLWRGNFVATSSVLVKREILQHITPAFTVGMSFAEDYLVWLKCLTLCRGYYLSTKLVTYVLSPRPRYRWGQILSNLLRLNLSYGAFLRRTPITVTRYAGMRLLLGLGSLVSVGSILLRFFHSRIKDLPQIS